MPDLLPVQQQIADLLAAGHTLTVRWDCGSDQSYVTTEVDGQELEANYSDPPNLAVLLDQYLTDELDLPDVGDFSMEGGGRIFQENRAVVIEYASRAEVDDDGEWMSEFSDEDLRGMGVDPATRPDPTGPPAPPADPYDPEMSENYSGRRVLFTLPADAAQL